MLCIPDSGTEPHLKRKKLWEETEAEVSYVTRDGGREKVGSSKNMVTRKQVREKPA
jgi:hypothetical protein